MSSKNLFRQLRKQMRVISNSRYQESIGGYRVYFVGIGERKVEFDGWWKTQLDFYSFDAAGFAQRVRVNNREEFLREENAVCLYAENVLYEEFYEAPQRFNDAWIVLRPATENHPLKRITGKKGYRLFQDEHKIIRQHIHEVAQIASADPGLRWGAQSAFLQILSHFHQAHAFSNGGEAVIAPLVRNASPNEDSFRTKVAAILSEDFRKDISVEELARRLLISRSTLSHRFSMEMGETMVQMKNRLRIQHAQELIGNSDWQLKEIAYEAGFDDPAYFTRLFGRIVGISPGEYRRMVGQGRPAPARN